MRRCSRPALAGGPGSRTGAAQPREAPGASSWTWGAVASCAFGTPVREPGPPGPSPDETTLYVANSDPDHAVWMAFPLEEDGTVGTGKVFFDATPWAKAGKPGLPDGMKVDAKGNLFATGPGGVHVFAPDGAHLGTFATGVPTANCGRGDDGSTLCITADMSVGRVRRNAKGKGF